MRRCGYRTGWPRLGCSEASGLVLLVALLGWAALGCDNDTLTTFRQTATTSVGEGLKTMLGGLLDGAVAVIQNAGDGSSETAGSSTSSSSTNSAG